MDDREKGARVSRRQFIGGVAGTAGFMILKPSQVRGTAANSTLRVGLLGCGSRGHTDTSNLVETGECRVTALADLFQDQLDKAKNSFDNMMQARGFSHVESSQTFCGPHAFEEIADSREVDVVVIATPPYFHPEHLEAQVLAGKHVYCEKPVAVDVWGANRVLDCGRKAEARLSLEVGFQLRQARAYIEQVHRIHGGSLGTIACGEGNYYSSYIKRPQWLRSAPDERIIRNWIHYRILSGDIIVEQNIHVIDQFNWILGAHPIRATAQGGRPFRPDDGDAYTNYNVVFQYPNGVGVTFASTQFNQGWSDVGWRFFGSKGVSETHYSGPVAIYGEEPWDAGSDPPAGQAGGGLKHRDNVEQADAQKKKSFVKSVMTGQYHNQAQEGVESALSAMLARQAAYTGTEATWDGLVASDEHWESAIDINQFKRYK
jgi:myo-inositol 2-dehydrogenase / D-chiro-inositol 1-dehydrogenase